VTNAGYLWIPYDSITNGSAKAATFMYFCHFNILTVSADTVRRTPPQLLTYISFDISVDRHSRVINTDGDPIGGLAAGELVGGLFYFNYPGGTGLMAGSVFGRIAGTSAARAALERK